MFRFNRLALMLGVCAWVGIALGAAIKIKSLTPIGEGVAESPDGDGMAIMNYHQGNNATEITVAITDFLPNTDYFVTVNPGIIRASLPTNSSGNANTHESIDFDICKYEPEVCVFIWRDDDGDLERDADPWWEPGPEDRAYGCTPCP